MQLSIHSLGPTFGAIIEGVDFTRPIPGEVFAEIEKTLWQYAVVGFRTPILTDEQQIRFSEYFGRLHVSILDPARRRHADGRFNDVGNIDIKGDIDRGAGVKYADANLFWHSDLTFLPQPAKVTILSARELPEHPPHTLFADLRAAWDALPATRQRQLENLRVQHSVFVARAKSGFTEFTEEERRKAPPVIHPLVQTHPRTGRKALLLSSSAEKVVGWSARESEGLFEELTEFATQEPFVLSYEWHDGDVLIWDGSATVHRATPFNSTTQKRQLHWNAVVELHAA